MNNVQILKNPCIPGLNLTWSGSFWFIVGFGLIIFYWGFLPVFSSVILACKFLFCGIFFCFLYQCDGGLIKGVGKFPSSVTFWNSYSISALLPCLPQKGERTPPLCWDLYLKKKINTHMKNEKNFQLILSFDWI